MSEQTPESTASLSDDGAFGGADSEPSMEDILASIRKIIADDADPVPLDGPEQVAAAETSTETSGELDMTSLMGELDMDLTGPEEAAPELEPLTLEDQIDEAFSLAEENDAPLEDVLSIPAIEEPSEDVPLTLDTPVDVEAEADDMDSLMNELMGGIEFAPEDAASVAPAPADVPEQSETVDAPRQPFEATSEADLDLVKSLMADLTDEDEVTDPVQAAVEEPVSTSDEDLDALEDNILDSILDMALTDETTRFGAETADDDMPDLSAIAAAAEADAAGQAAPAEPVEQTPIQSDPSELETPMPSAQRSDAILDDVTEAATKSAFAELNQVVEDKAVLSERGPRIGDLVQDALRPMLKEWLDENLQAIVERAVAKEVKRIADGK